MTTEGSLKLPLLICTLTFDPPTGFNVSISLDWVYLNTTCGAQQVGTPFTAIAVYDEGYAQLSRVCWLDPVVPPPSATPTPSIFWDGRRQRRAQAPPSQAFSAGNTQPSSFNSAGSLTLRISVRDASLPAYGFSLSYVFSGAPLMSVTATPTPSSTSGGESITLSPSVSSSFAGKQPPVFDSPSATMSATASVTSSATDELFVSPYVTLSPKYTRSLTASPLPWLASRSPYPTPRGSATSTRLPPAPPFPTYSTAHVKVRGSWGSRRPDFAVMQRELAALLGVAPYRFTDFVYGGDTQVSFQIIAPVAGSGADDDDEESDDDAGGGGGGIPTSSTTPSANYSPLPNDDETGDGDEVEYPDDPEGDTPATDDDAEDYPPSGGDGDTPPPTSDSDDLPTSDGEDGGWGARRRLAGGASADASTLVRRLLRALAAPTYAVTNTVVLRLIYANTMGVGWSTPALISISPPAAVIYVPYTRPPYPAPPQACATYQIRNSGGASLIISAVAARALEPYPTLSATVTTQLPLVVPSLGYGTLSVCVWPAAFPAGSSVPATLVVDLTHNVPDGAHAVGLTVSFTGVPAAPSAAPASDGSVGALVSSSAFTAGIVSAYALLLLLCVAACVVYYRCCRRAGGRRGGGGHTKLGEFRGNGGGSASASRPPRPTEPDGPDGGEEGGGGGAGGTGSAGGSSSSSMSSGSGGGGLAGARAAAAAAASSSTSSSSGGGRAHIGGSSGGGRDSRGQRILTGAGRLHPQGGGTAGGLGRVGCGGRPILPGVGGSVGVGLREGLSYPGHGHRGNQEPANTGGGGGGHSGLCLGSLQPGSSPRGSCGLHIHTCFIICTNSPSNYLTWGVIANAIP